MGGGALTDYASEFCLDRYDTFYYNELNSNVANHFKRAIEGDVHPRWVDRDEFKNSENLDFFDRSVFTFGNKNSRLTYFATPLRADLEKRIFLHKISKEDAEKEAEKNGFINIRCEPLSRWNRLLGMKKSPEVLKRIEITSLDYHDYVYQDGDVVYCDIPYELTKGGNTELYGAEFDTDKFFEWARSQSYPVYVSSYLRGVPVWVKKTTTNMNPSDYRVETIFKV